jgi:hypothetical protein
MPQNIGGALGLHRIACSDIGLRADLTARWNSGTRGVRNLEAEVIRPLSRENLRGGEYDSCRFVADLHLSADLFDRRKQRLGLDSLLGTSPEVAALDDGAALIGKFKQFLNLSREISLGTDLRVKVAKPLHSLQVLSLLPKVALQIELCGVEQEEMNRCVEP